jgi:hypothetical protein
MLHKMIFDIQKIFLASQLHVCTSFRDGFGSGRGLLYHFQLILNVIPERTLERRRIRSERVEQG